MRDVAFFYANAYLVNQLSSSQENQKKKNLAQPGHLAKKGGPKVSKVLNAVSESPDVPRAPVPMGHLSRLPAPSCSDATRRT